MHPLAITFGVLFSFMWSSAFSVAKIAVQDAPPLSLLTLRFLVSGAIALFLARLTGERLPTGRRTWLAVGVLGIAQNALYLGLIFLAVQYVPAALAAIIASALPLLVAVASPLFTQERPTPMVVAGLLVGFGGVIYIMHDRVSGGVAPLGVVLCVIAVSALTAATLIVNRGRFEGGLLMVVGLQMWAGCLTLAPFALAVESPTAFEATPRLAVAFAYIVLVPGLLATFVWFKLIRTIGPTRASVFHFLNPAFGVVVAWLLLGEPLGSTTLTGVVLIALGILLVQLARLRAQKSKE